MIATANVSRTTTKSSTPVVYVPRRFRIGGLEGIRPGAAIVGTPQGDGTVVIDVESTPYVEPSPERWSNWAAEALRRHVADEEELFLGEVAESRIVSEADLIEVGRYVQGRMRLAYHEGGLQLTRWIDAGRAAYVADGYLSPEFT
jgi:hypothetical protein